MKTIRSSFQVTTQHWLKIVTCSIADEVKVKSKKNNVEKMKKERDKQKSNGASLSGKK